MEKEKREGGTLVGGGNREGREKDRKKKNREIKRETCYIIYNKLHSLALSFAVC